MGSNQTDRDGFVSGLRALADLLEGHPELPLPYSGSGPSPLDFYELGTVDSRAMAQAWARAFPGRLEKVYERDVFRMRGQLDGLHVDFTTYRSDVCRRVVTGTREVTEEVPDPDAPTITRTRVIEDVLWKCEPLLAPSPAAAEAVA